MEKIGNQLTNIKTRGNFRELNERASQGRLSAPPSNHPIWDVWNQIKSAYPGPTTNWEDIPPQIWTFAVQELTPAQLTRGIETMARSDDPFPPSAGVFRDWCTAWKDTAQRQDFTGHAQLEDLTAKERRIAIGKSEIEKLKALFG